MGRLALCRTAAWLACGWLASGAAAAQESVHAAQQLAGEPHPPGYMVFQFNDWYTASYHDAPGSANKLVFRWQFPFSLDGKDHVVRLTVPWVTSDPSGANGLDDISAYGLRLFDQSWGRWGAGISGSLPTGQPGLTDDKWTVGPAFRVEGPDKRKVRWGLQAESFFSVAGSAQADAVGFVRLKPFLSYQLTGGRFVSIGSSMLVYDLRESNWSTLRLGVAYGKVVTFGGQLWKPSIDADYDFRNEVGNAEWTFRLELSLLVPTD